ncbi:major facilitator superfamily domain-containing protein [Xylariomycetidae sp. FL0641]|nr:major facilitator superfamily domain-containing protein [Xylariomycetidae sp. FL0641]
MFKSRDFSKKASHEGADDKPGASPNGENPDVNQDAIETPSAETDDDDDDDASETPAGTPRHRQSKEGQRSFNRISGDLRRTTSSVVSRVASRVTTRSWPEPPPPPDGGAQAWTQVAMGWLVIFCTWGYVNSFGAFQAYYTASATTLAGATPSQISWIGSIQIFLTLMVGTGSGRLLDAGLFLPTLCVGAALQVLGMFLMSIATTYWQLMLTQGILTGIGGGIFFTPSMALVATYWSKRRGLAVGLATTGNSAGGMIYPTVVRELIPRLGFAWTTRVLAFINLSLLAVVIAFMRPRLPPRKSGPFIDVSAFKELPYLGFVCGTFFLMWANYYTFYYISSFAEETLGVSYEDAAILLIILNGAGIPFRVFPPMLADRIGPFNVLVPTVAAWAVVAWCWLAVRNVSQYYAWTVFFGIISGSFQCLTATTVAAITKHLDHVGTRLGMAFGIISIAALTGPPLGGAIQGSQGGSYTGSQAWAATVILVGFCLFLAARLNLGGFNIRARC